MLGNTWRFGCRVYSLGAFVGFAGCHLLEVVATQERVAAERVEEAANTVTLLAQLLPGGGKSSRRRRTISHLALSLVYTQEARGTRASEANLGAARVEEVLVASLL